MRVCLLASGSRGNCTLIEVDGRRLLIDAGLSGRETERRLAGIGISPEDLDAILVTHEHHDHVGGIGPLSRRYQLPVHIAPQTQAALPRLGTISVLHHFSTGSAFTVAGLSVVPFATTHDAVSPVGFVIHSREGKIGYATDLGMPTRLVADQLQQCRALVLEANHDDQMLQDGPYPWSLKQRIRSRHGHLSNREAMQLLAQVAWPGLEALFLAHLSEENNCPQLVMESFRGILDDCGYGPEIILGSQHQVSICYQSASAIVV